MTLAVFVNTDMSSATLKDATIQGASFNNNVGVIDIGDTVSITHDMLERTKSYKDDHDFSGITFNSADLSDFDFSGINLTGASFYNTDLSNADMSDALLMGTSLRNSTLTGVDFSGADLRNADLYLSTGFDVNGHQNLIYTNGQIYNLTLSAAGNKLTITAGSNINSFLNGTIASISNDATLSLTAHSVLELKNNSHLTLTDTGNLQLFYDTSTPNALASIVLQSGSSLTLDPDAFIDIIINDMSVAGFQITLLSWQDDEDVADLLSRLLNGSGYLINGQSLAQLDLNIVIDHNAKTFSLASIYIPEPSSVTLSLLAIAGLLARRRRLIQR